jgi:hypothetical protein
VVAIIFVIQNIHAANISFLGIHLLLPLALELFLATVAGSVMTIAAGPARTAKVRKFLRRGQPRPDSNSRRADSRLRRPNQANDRHDDLHRASDTPLYSVRTSGGCRDQPADLDAGALS